MPSSKTISSADSGWLGFVAVAVRSRRSSQEIEDAIGKISDGTARRFAREILTASTRGLDAVPPMDRETVAGFLAWGAGETTGGAT